MTFNNIDLYCQVIGSIMKDPVLLQNLPNKITLQDFSKENTIARTVFFAVDTLVSNNAQVINAATIQALLHSYETLDANYRHFKGDEFVEMCLEKGQPENFDTFYRKLKKTSLLYDLKSHGYDVSPYDFEGMAEGSRKEMECIERFEEATEDEILDYVEKQLADLRSRHTTSCDSAEGVGDGVEDLFGNLGIVTDQGAELRGTMFNSMVRGARLGCLYIRSASTAGGKTRSSVFDACNMVFPVRWDAARNSFIFIKDMVPQPVLFITTEQTKDEIKMTVAAYLSGIEEAKIRTGLLDIEEKDRLKIASMIMTKYSHLFTLDEISDPDLSNVQNIIKKHVVLGGKKYVFYDYIFTSPALINQFGAARIREDVALGMLSNQLKEIAKTYNVFVMTATQVNAAGLEAGKRHDQGAIRGSKAIADKADIGCIITAVDKVDLEQIQTYADDCGVNPTHVIDLYKIRSGRFKNTRLWIKYDLGTGERTDLFLTDQDNQRLSFHNYELVKPLSDSCIKWTPRQTVEFLERE